MSSQHTKYISPKFKQPKDYRYLHLKSLSIDGWLAKGRYSLRGLWQDLHASTTQSHSFSITFQRWNPNKHISRQKNISISGLPQL